MKKTVCILLAVLIAMTCALATAEGKTTPNKVKTNIKLKKTYPGNPVIEGESPVTGLPVTEEYTPITLVLDNAEEAYPLWGVSEASIMFQVPNAGRGATKLLALFADEYPEKAGGSRSARMSMLPIANCFDAAFASGGLGIAKGTKVDMEHYLMKWKYKTNKKYFNLLGNYYKAREPFVHNGHNLSFLVREAHDHLIEEKVSFEPRPFLFTDEPLTRGEPAEKITVKHYTDKKKGTLNNASYAEYSYDPGEGYTRTTATGLNTDRFTEKPLVYQNVIVLRTTVKLQSGHPYFKDHLKGSGSADIFQSGKYIRGAWTRSGDNGRLVLTDEKGEELRLQRGKSFIVFTDETTDVIYE